MHSMHSFAATAAIFFLRKGAKRWRKRKQDRGIKHYLNTNMEIFNISDLNDDWLSREVQREQARRCKC